MPSEEHSELEERAIAWLKQQGFVDIMTETKIVVVGDSAGKIACKTGNPYGTTRTPDVIGLGSTRKVIIECGSMVRPDKLYQFRDLGFEVYIWPYDAVEPYLWSKDVRFCGHCGRKFEHLDVSV